MAEGWIPYGPILWTEPVSPHITVVFPVGIYTLRPGRVPVISWNNTVECYRY